MTVTRGTSNGNVSGSAADRRRRRAWLLDTYRADFDVIDANAPMRDLLGPKYSVPPLLIPVPRNAGGAMAARCYRCGCLLTIETLTVDRIVPGCKGGRYIRTNIRPACGPCNSETGGALRSASVGHVALAEAAVAHA